MMTPSIETMTILTLHVRPRSEMQAEFLEWQAKLNSLIVSFPGFVSLETVLNPHVENEWMVVQRFRDTESLNAWCESNPYRNLESEVKNLVDSQIIASKSGVKSLKNGVTEIFVTKVTPEKEKDFLKWLAKIHQVEAKFPGFRGTYIQSPTSSNQENWITLLQFDQLENLDRWLNSAERQAVLKESIPLIRSLENHRIISPYAGWFASLIRKGETPPLWKQTMIILLVLFPIVMLEFKYLNPYTAPLNLSLATFIGNAISVSLVSWPMMPAAIRLLSWWLVPHKANHKRATVLGTLLLLVLYAIEVALFWK